MHHIITSIINNVIINLVSSYLWSTKLVESKPIQVDHHTIVRKTVHLSVEKQNRGIATFGQTGFRAIQTGIGPSRWSADRRGDMATDDRMMIDSSEDETLETLVPSAKRRKFSHIVLEKKRRELGVFDAENGGLKRGRHRLWKAVLI